MSNFTFLQAEWPDLHDAASKAESFARPDARTACFYARRGLEVMVHWLYKHDASLRLSYQDNLSALIHEPTLFHVDYWLAHTYARGAKPLPGLAFDLNALPKTTPLPRQTIGQLQRLEKELRERDEKLSTLLADKTTLDEELRRLRTEVAEAKKANSTQLDTHDYSEAETRNYFIDLLLREAGWIEFVNLIVDHLTSHGAMNPELLYQSPLTDITPQGPDGLFSAAQVDQLRLAT